MVSQFEYLEEKEPTLKKSANQALHKKNTTVLKNIKYC